jgi:hypothetical protein
MPQAKKYLCSRRIMLYQFPRRLRNYADDIYRSPNDPSSGVNE